MPDKKPKRPSKLELDNEDWLRGRTGDLVGADNRPITTHQQLEEVVEMDLEKFAELPAARPYQRLLRQAGVKMEKAEPEGGDMHVMVPVGVVDTVQPPKKKKRKKKRRTLDADFRFRDLMDGR